MNLTREQAIEEHRKMWNWIADEIKRVKHVVGIGFYKKRYLKMYGFKNIKNNCFMCEYIENINRHCEVCPINPHPYSSDCFGGLFEKCFDAETWRYQAVLARKIAELPERKDV